MLASFRTTHDLPQKSQFPAGLTRAEAQVPDQARVAGAEALGELGDEGLQVLSSLLGCVYVSEELSQRVGEELVTEVMELHQLIQHVSPEEGHTHIHIIDHRYLFSSLAAYFTTVNTIIFITTTSIIFITSIPLVEVDAQHLPVESASVENELGQLCGVVSQDSFRHEVVDAL